MTAVFASIYKPPDALYNMCRTVKTEVADVNGKIQRGIEITILMVLCIFVVISAVRR